MPVDLEQFEADLKAIKTWEGMSEDELSSAATDFKNILTNTLKAEDLTPKEKGQLVTKYLEIWEADAVLGIYCAYLAEANLQNAELQGANLQGANLQGANLQEANLQQANLEGANLQEANLQNAYLLQADLEGANLQGANLEEANLGATNLRWADLRGASLKEVNLLISLLKGAILIGTDLTNVPYLTQEDINSTITTPEQLAARIQSILDLPDTDITQKHLNGLPNLYRAATEQEANEPCNEVAKALCQKFPWFSQKTPKHWGSEAKSRLMDGSFGKATTFLQNTALPPELKEKIVSEVIAGTSDRAAEPDRLSSRISRILTDQAQQSVGERNFSAREATSFINLIKKDTNTREHSILERIEAEWEAEWEAYIQQRQQEQGRQH